tara:strand:- start:1049 stop:1969 length:921 start_codon:yes stop_codon:yes gene_type:complete
MKPVILFRKDLHSEEEMKVASKYFEVVESRVLCGGSLVIGRYSALPFYKELQTDLELNGCKLINSYEQHKYIANFDWYADMRAVTPVTWFEDTFSFATYEGPFVIKGKTNSRKHQWNTLMYAETRQDAIHIAAELNADPHIGSQGVIFRKYVPLRTFEIGINDLPFTNEWRFFFFKDTLLTYGYYWSQAKHVDIAEMSEEGILFARRCAECICHRCEFFALDIAERAEGGWTLIEVNDAQMSGLSECNSDVFYGTLKDACLEAEFGKPKPKPEPELEPEPVPEPKTRASPPPPTQVKNDQAEWSGL